MCSAFPGFAEGVLSFFVSFPVASTAVAGGTARECADVRTGVAFHVFSGMFVSSSLYSKGEEGEPSYLSSQRRRVNFGHCGHLKGPSPSPVLIGLCEETILEGL
jgi:hypothetical protein